MVRPPSIVSFPEDNLSKCQWIFTKLNVCIDIVEILFGIANGQISSIFDSYLPATRPYFHFRMIALVNIKGFLSNFVCALILRRSGLGLRMGKFRQILTELSAHDTSVFSFPGDNFCKYQWIFTICALILSRSALGLPIGIFCRFFDRVICPQYICILVSGQKLE